jgi:hypothetical protein
MIEPCPCGPPQHPRVVTNPSGRDRLDYRVGDFATFREALLRSLPGEVQLGSNWRPGADGDLAVQMVEWWAYLADILTMYSEQIAQQTYLATADERNHPDALRRLVSLLGYRPRPGIASSAVLGALVAGRGPVKLRHGFQIRSKATPGKPPQIFELDADSVLTSPDAVALDPPPQAADLAGRDNFLLKGTVSTIRKGSDIVIVAKGWTGSGKWELSTVKEIRKEKGPRQETNTRVFLTSRLDHLSSGAAPESYRVIYSTLTTNPWDITTDTSITSTTIDLSSVVRQIRPGDPVLLFRATTAGSHSQLVSVMSYQESVGTVPNSGTTPPQPLPILHTQLTFSPSIDATEWQSNVKSTEVRYGFRDAGELISPPAPTYQFPADLTAVYPGTVPSSLASPTVALLLEDAHGSGARAVGQPAYDGDRLDKLTDLSLTDLPGPLETPLRGLFNLLVASRGQSVANEVLGRGDATQISQEFTLKKSPLTYLAAPGSELGYRSTLQVNVDGIPWSEAASFFGQSPDARVFVTREDAEMKTHVMFGNGVNGAGLPSGATVVASYRAGSGSAAPDEGALTGIVRPFPGLKAIRNPIPAGGGADPDPADKVRRLAPRSVLTFGRAVSATDYEAIAAQAPGVNRARAYWSWNDQKQRNLVAVYVGDNSKALQSAKAALAGTEDPNRPVDVQQAVGVGTGDLILRVHVPAAADPASVIASLDTALFDDRVGLFGLQNVRIGQAFFASQIVAACMTVDGVISAEVVNFDYGMTPIDGVLYDPGVGRYFTPDLNNRYYELVPA